MQIKNYRKKLLPTAQQSDRGFSLIETVIALITLGVCLAYAMPLFLYAKINNSKSEIRTGALIVSQRIFDDIRSKRFIDMPLTDGTVRDVDVNLTNSGTTWKTGVNSDGSNPVVQPSDITTPRLVAEGGTVTPQEKLLTFAMGRQYRTKVTYCGGVNSDTTVCSTKYRKFKVEVSYNGSKVYDLEGTYTEFE